MQGTVLLEIRKLSPCFGPSHPHASVSAQCPGLSQGQEHSQWLNTNFCPSGSPKCEGKEPAARNGLWKGTNSCAYLWLWACSHFSLTPGLCRSDSLWRDGRFKPLQVQYLQYLALPIPQDHKTSYETTLTFPSSNSGPAAWDTGRSLASQGNERHLVLQEWAKLGKSFALQHKQQSPSLAVIPSLQVFIFEPQQCPKLHPRPD